jgi:two-component system, OmpR family, sensor histidine kinase KdpD
MSEIELEKAQRKDLLAVINGESDRFNRLVGEAGELVELDSHQLQFHFEARHVQEAIDNAIKSAPSALQRHPLEVTIPPNLPCVQKALYRLMRSFDLIEKSFHLGSDSVFPQPL